MNKSLTQYDITQKAIIQATEELRLKGIFYPILVSGESHGSLLDRINRYSQQHSELVVKIIRETPNPRPLVFENVRPKQEWAKSYYDK